MSSQDPPRPGGDVPPPNTGAKLVASLVVGATTAGQAAIIRNIGGAAAAGYRPSLPSLLFNARTYMGAPAPVRAASLVTLGATALLMHAIGRPSPSQTRQYMQSKVEDIWSAGEKTPK
jgi:hypothetical protein